MKPIYIVSILSLAFVSSSYASPSNGADHAAAIQGLRAAYQAEESIQADIKAGQNVKVAKLALSILVPEGIKELRAAGDNEQADQFEREWNNDILPSLDRAKTPMELGDHDPLSPWLANFYKTLVADTHGLVKSIQIINDINTANYALGVVLFPNGKWRQHTAYDRIEYRKHFIPFADIATYWVSLEACNYYAQQYKQLCSYGAETLEHYMGRYVAPVLSDELFAILTGHQNAQTCNYNSLSESDFEQQVLQQFPQLQ